MYKRPPITEAVIELRFKPNLDAATMSKVTKKFQNEYPLPPTMNYHVDVIIGDKKKPSANQRLTGIRLASSDGTSVVVVSSGSFSVSQLAPYCGWSAFSARFKENLSRFKQVVDFISITRIGVRFINR